MGKRYQINEEQVNEICRIRKENKDKNIEKRLKALLLHARGESHIEIARQTGFAASYISALVSKYCRNGIETIIENKYRGNRRNMSIEAEKAFLEVYREQAEQGHIVEVSTIKAAYEEKVGHPIGGSQIYYVLRRHRWRKVMPRSKHPNKADEEAIAASKKLTKLSERSWKIIQAEKSD